MVSFKLIAFIHIFWSSFYLKSGKQIAISTHTDKANESIARLNKREGAEIQAPNLLHTSPSSPPC